jgi:hypothetical protein
MKALPTEWRPVAVANLQKELGSFRNWVLCGGYSIDKWAGQNTRPHGDIDVGVFRTELRQCLEAIGQVRVYLCSPPGVHAPWQGGDAPESVHDIWITDNTGEFWILQVMVFDDDGDRVSYRRDRRIHWSKRSHSIDVAGVSLLNPFITMLYKLNKKGMEDKEVADIIALIETYAKSINPANPSLPLGSLSLGDRR